MLGYGGSWTWTHQLGDLALGRRQLGAARAPPADAGQLPAVADHTQVADPDKW
jgi:hypothetical protein